LYLIAYLAVLCVTPFSGQYLRYLMPIAPLLVLAALVVVNEIGDRQRGARGWAAARFELPALAVLGPALLVQVIVTGLVYAGDYRSIAYVDANGKPVSYKLFFYDEQSRRFDQAVDYLQSRVQRPSVVAAGTPHWI